MVNRNIQELTTATAFDKDGEKLGSVKEVYLNDHTGQPDFVEVGHGLFGMSSSLVPLRGHRLDGENLRLAFSKDRIKDAPNIDDDAHLSENDQDTIYRHYEIDTTENVESYDAHHTDNTDATGRHVAGGYAHTRDEDLHDNQFQTPDARIDGAPDSAVAADAADDRESLIRSEERLNVDKERVTTGDARLRKYVVHDTETVDVPVEREEVRVERTPVDPTDTRAGRGEALGEDEASVTLHEEHVNVTKDSVPVEEVRLDKKTVRDTETISEDVAHEEIDVDGNTRNTRNQR